MRSQPPSRLHVGCEVNTLAPMYRLLLAILVFGSSCGPPPPPPPAPPPPTPAPPVSREAVPEPEAAHLWGPDESVVPEETAKIEVKGHRWIPAAEILDTVRAARGTGDLTFLGDFAELTRDERPEVAAAGREALAELLSRIPRAKEPAGTASEVALIARVRATGSFFNVRRALREELGRAGLLVVRPDLPPPALLVIADFRETPGDPYQEVGRGGFVMAHSVRMSLVAWIVDARAPRILGWVKASAHARPKEAKEGELRKLSGEEFRTHLGKSGLGGYVLAALGRREEFSKLLLDRGLDDPLRALAEATAFRPETPEEKARFLIADRRYLECAKLGRAGLEVLVPVYSELSYRDDDRPEYEVAQAIASVEAPELAAALKSLVTLFPVGNLMQTDYLRIDKKTAVLFLERLAEVGKKEDAVVVQRWTDAKWGPEVSAAARKAKATLDSRP